MKKKISFLLVLTMVLMLIPAFSVPAFASGSEITTPLDFTKESVRNAYATEQNGVQFITTADTFWEGTPYEYTQISYELILSGATVNCSTYQKTETAFGVNVPDGTTITLADGTTNTVKAGLGINGSYGITSLDASGNPGSIEIRTVYGAASKGTLTVESGAADSSDAAYGIYAKKLEVGSTILNSIGVNSGILTEGSGEEGNAGFGDSIVTAVATSSSTAAAIVCSGDFNVGNDSTLSAWNQNVASSSSAAITAGRAYLVNVNAEISGGTRVVTGDTVKFIQTGSSAVEITFPDACTMGGKNYKSIEEAIYAAEDTPSTIKLLRHTEIFSQTDIEDDQDITIDLNGFYILASEKKMECSAFYICDEGKLTITDSNPAAAHSLYLNPEGLAIAELGGSGNSPLSINGGGIGGFDKRSADTDSSAGSVFNNWGTLVLNGGNIIYNRADYGGAVHSGDGSVLEINGASFYANEATLDGGAVYLDDGSKGALKSGTQLNNKAGCGGGFAYVDTDAELIMSGGIITGNEADEGGGIYINESYYSYNYCAVFKMSGGEFAKNIARSNGGAIYANSLLYLGGAAKLSDADPAKNSHLTSGAVNNLYLDEEAYVVIGDGTNGVEAPKPGMKVGVTVKALDSLLGAYIITGESDADYSAYFIGDDASLPAIKDYIVEGGFHVVGIPVPDYTIVLKDGKAYKNSVSAGSEISPNGLDFNDTLQRWEMNDFIFMTTASTAVEFLDSSAKLYIGGTSENRIQSYSCDEDSVGLKANNIEVEADNILEIYGESMSTAFDCQSLVFTGAGDISLNAASQAIRAGERVLAKITAYSDEPLVWDGGQKTYLYPGLDSPTPFMWISTLFQFNDILGNGNCSFSDYEIGQKYFSGKNYTFEGWYANGDYSSPRLQSAAAADRYTEYLAKWTNGTNEVLLYGLDFLDSEIADTYSSANGGKNGVSWNASAKILTLNNVTIDNISRENGLKLPADSTIALAGQNVIFHEIYGSYALECEGLRICGSGKLFVNTVDRGISSDSEYLIINGADVSVTAEELGVYAGRDRIQVINNGVISVIIPENNAAFYAEEGIQAKSMTGGMAYDRNGGGTFVSGKTIEIYPLSDDTPVVLIGTERQSYDGDSSPSGKPASKANTNTVAFADVDPQAYYYDAVKWAAEKGITSGKTETTFAPNDTCTRSEFVTFLWRAAGQPVVDYLMPFTDINEDSYYGEALRWAASEGIVKGATATTFNPRGTITRAQAAAYLYRYAKAPAVANMTANGPAASPFGDVDGAAYYYDAVLWAKAQGITSGKTETTFGPNDNCLRGQMAVFLYKYFAK